MATTRRPFGLSEEDKKSDDPRFKGPTGVTSWLRSWKTVRRRRIVFALLAVWLLYLFFKNIPTDLAPVSKRYDQYGAQRASAPRPDLSSNETAAVLQNGPDDGLGQDYNGPIKFYKLASSLRAYDHHSHAQNNVLFAFSGSRSASLVVSAACSMAYQNQTKVHVALMGRHEVDVLTLLGLNGIPETECPISWYDARPDYPAESTVERMGTSVEAALAHLHKALSVQAILFDDAPREDDYFRNAIKARARYFWIPAINVPDRDAWMLALDAQSLRQWNTVSIDIIVRAPSESSGSLIRLLRSLQKADYGGLSYPKLTVELPAISDQVLLDHIAGYQWPPHSSPSERRLSVRRRTDPKITGPTAASLSTLESFYPPTLQSHVLILSPDAELSPNYYQILMYLVLEYKYGIRFLDISHKLLGVSLEANLQQQSGSEGSAFLQQTPGDNAVLYFGDRWNDLHNFVSLRINADPEWTKTAGPTFKASSSTSVWLEAASELMQAQSYLLICPSFGKGSSPLVTIHSELRHQSTASEVTNWDDKNAPMGELDLAEQGDTLTLKEHKRQGDLERPMLSAASVVSLLAGGSPITPSSGKTPIFDVTGNRITWDDVAEGSTSYREKFASSVGGCSSKSPRDGEAYSIENLFCK